MANIFKAFVNMIPSDPLLVGTVSLVLTDMCNVDLVGGGTIRVSGTASLGDKVFIRGGIIIDSAPDLPSVNVTIY
jgi:hypothetical protein